MNILELAHGIHEGIDEATYHQNVLGMCSVSALTLFAQTPSKYRASIAGTRPRKETPALNFGKAIHSALLEPEVFAEKYVVEPDFGPIRKTGDVTSEQAKENKLRREAWRQAHEGATILDSASGVKTLGMIKRIVERRPTDPPAAALFEGGKPEVTLRWKDPRTGLECRARDDCWQEDLATVADYKSCEDASPDGFARQASTYQYHWIEAFYRMGHQVLGKDINSLAFVAQEKIEPYDFGIYYLDPAAVLLGMESIERQMNRMVQCLEEDLWPGYSKSIVTIGLRSWVRE